jgi:CRP-like cAMP-binding protein
MEAKLAGNNGVNGDNSRTARRENLTPARMRPQPERLFRWRCSRISISSGAFRSSRCLTNEQAQGIADSVVKRRFRRGEIVVEHGKKSNALFILLTGRARVLTADSRGREVILAVLQSGDYVGEMSLIDNEPHSATVRAEVQTDMLILGRAEFARCLPENSSLSYAIMRGLVQRLRSADRQIESLALLDVYGRVARTLLDMSEMDGEIKVIRNKVSRQDLAKVVGASREMVSRVMKDLEGRGMVQTQENGWVVIKEQLTA